MALDAVDEYLASRAPALFAPVIDHLREVGEARSATEIEDHFKRNYGIGGVTGVMTTTIALETSKGDLPLALALGIILLTIVFALNGAVYSIREWSLRRHG